MDDYILNDHNKEEFPPAHTVGFDISTINLLKIK